MTDDGLNGQWVGIDGGTLVIANVDEIADGHQGTISLIEQDRKIPSSFAFFKIPTKAAPFSIPALEISAVHPIMGTLHRWEEIKDLFPGSDFSSLAEVTGSWDDHRLNVEWATRQAKGTFTLLRSQAGTSSKVKAEEMSWEEFKKEASTFKTPGTVFRGQNDTHHLRSAFHRRGRADLFRFLTEDLSTLA
jgi:hypothetical protein